MKCTVVLLSVGRETLISLPSILIVISGLNSFTSSPLGPLTVAVDPLSVTVTPAGITIVFYLYGTFIAPPYGLLFLTKRMLVLLRRLV